MCQEFKMKDLGETKYYLGIHFEHQGQQDYPHAPEPVHPPATREVQSFKEGKVAPTPLEEGHTLTGKSPWKLGEEGEMRGVAYAQRGRKPQLP